MRIETLIRPGTAPRARRSLPIMLIAGATLGLGAAHAAAQVELRISPQASWISPSGTYEAAINLPGVDLNFDLPDFTTVGGSIGIARAGWPIELRVSGFTTTERQEVESVLVCGRAGDCTDDSAFLGRVAMSGWTGELLLTPLPHAALQPYVLAGAGAARYSFHWPPRPPEELSQTIGPVDRTSFITRAGGGLAVSVGPFTAHAEAADLMTWLGDPGTTEHALALTLGLGLRIR